MSDEESGGEHTNAKYYPPPEPKLPKPAPKKAKVKKQRPPPRVKKGEESKSKGPVFIITDPVEWDRLLRDVPLRSGEIRFYRGRPNPVSFK